MRRRVRPSGSELRLNLPANVSLTDERGNISCFSRESNNNILVLKLSHNRLIEFYCIFAHKAGSKTKLLRYQRRFTLRSKSKVSSGVNQSMNEG